MWVKINEYRPKDLFNIEYCEEHFPDKSKAATAVVHAVEKVDENKARTLISDEKRQNLIIAISRLPSADIFLTAIDVLNERHVTRDNLESLLRSWPAEEFDELIKEAAADPHAKWEKIETYFIKLGQKKKFDVRIKVWIFFLQFKITLQQIHD